MIFFLESFFFLIFHDNTVRAKLFTEKEGSNNENKNADSAFMLMKKFFAFHKVSHPDYFNHSYNNRNQIPSRAIMKSDKQ